MWLSEDARRQTAPGSTTNTDSTDPMECSGLIYHAQLGVWVHPGGLSEITPARLRAAMLAEALDLPTAVLWLTEPFGYAEAYYAVVCGDPRCVRRSRS